MNETRPRRWLLTRKKKQDKHETEFNKKAVKIMAQATGAKCWYCGIELNTINIASLDHIKPKSKGGTDYPENVALACSQCNRAKYSDDAVEFLKWLAHVRSSHFECRILGRLSKQEIEELDAEEWDHLQKEFWNF